MAERFDFGNVAAPRATSTRWSSKCILQADNRSRNKLLNMPVGHVSFFQADAFSALSRLKLSSMTITTASEIFETKCLAPLDAREALIDEVWRGLRKRPRSLVPWMLYDSEGSRLFECITTLPEYYPTRMERDILANYAEAMIAETGSDYSRPMRLLELGAGTAAKTGILLEAAARMRNEVTYIPVDVSPDALEAACDSIGSLLPDVQLQPMVANYVTHPPKLERFEGTTLAMYIGSSIGNFPPEEARTILRNLRSELGPGDALLLGTDTLIARYQDTEMPERYSTKSAYQSYLKCHIKPRWGSTPLPDVKPITVEGWLNGLKLAPKTKGHIKQLMHVLFECALRWEQADKNPIALVRLKEGTKRESKPRILTTAEFKALVAALSEPYKTMVLIAGCLGLRVSEIMGLQWRDFDFENGTLLVQRGVVHGQVGDVKTEYSKDHLPLDPLLVDVLTKHQERCHKTEEGWLFANPATDRPYHQEQIVKTHMKAAATAAEIKGKVGWHTFRHDYRAWMGDTKASLSVQQELMRHASITTTMNVYGRAMTNTKRKANSKIVKMVLQDSKPRKVAFSA
jgi:integrase